LHWNPQLFPSHVALALAGGMHGVHDEVPHDATLVLSAHTPLQLWKPKLHTELQLEPLQSSLAFAGGGGHAVHDMPQLARLVLLTHTPPQS
jgi:hypothetical protein